ncbi:MAG TPA: hypothetical protein VI248_19225 [Kineosporiaceae bacterium]
MSGPPASGPPASGHRAAAERRPTRRQSALAVVMLAVTVIAGTTTATAGLAQPPPVALARAGYSTSRTGAWFNDVTLGRTRGADQYAQASVTGLLDDAERAGFMLRYANRTSRIRVSVSGTDWRIEPSGGVPLGGQFSHGPSGTLRVEVQGRAVRVRWNGVLVAVREVVGDYPGRHVVPTVRQARPVVRLRSLRAATLPPTSSRSSRAPATASRGVVPTPGPPAARSAVDAPARTWWSGASGDAAASGGYGAWRGTPVQIGGTWNDTYDAQINEWSICGSGGWAGWNGPLDIAVGAIYHSRGETWAAAAAGRYDARWTAALQRIRRCWGDRDPRLLYLRFAHEMNLPNDWAVHRGEERDFARAITRFSTLRYRILPGARLVLCPNDGTDGGLGGLDIRKLWPGRDARGRRVADVYAVDSYNQYPHVSTSSEFTRKANGEYPGGVPLGIERHRQFAERMGVPFAISEWANNGEAGSAGGGGESPLYVRQFHAWARAHAGNVAHPEPGQLLYEIHFNLRRQFALWPATVQPQTAAAYRSLPWGR